MRFKLGISPCPNDTFMFHAILERKIDMRGFEFDVQLLDIQELNSALSRRQFDFSKASSVAAIVARDAYRLVDAGAAIGFGVGPLLVSSADAPPLDAQGARILLPGKETTAALLFRHFLSSHGSVSHTVFSEIMPALAEGRADYGVVIHEGRFTYQEHGLKLVADLGQLWEQRYNAPLPLGCIVASRAISEETQDIFTNLVRDSIRYGYEHRDEVVVTMRRYARELSDKVLWSHVELYVNEWSVKLGTQGDQAMRRFREVVERS
jgi:1,4-dihydroxy-6-naphthoate synthase